VRPFIRVTVIYLLFLLSGASSLVYQVVWVRQLGYAFGNTVHSAALVVAVLGFGVSFTLSMLDTWVASLSVYTLAANGWQYLTTGLICCARCSRSRYWRPSRC
jgi:hypothetical protein